MAGRPKGIPKTGGRQKGAVNRLTAAKEAAIAASGLTPLEYMLARLRDTKLDSAERDKMAIAAAPYCHAKLAAIEHKGDMTVTNQTKAQRDAAISAAMMANG